MIKIAVIIMAAMTTLSSASIINLSGNAQPRFEGSPIPGGLIRIGMLSSAPASTSFADIEAAFQEFGTAVVPTGGFTPNTFSSSTSRAAASPFDNQQVYIWVFDSSTIDDSTSHTIFSILDPDDPGEGPAWRFPVHVGNGIDSTTIRISAATLAHADLSLSPFASVSGNLLDITANRIPEPSGTLLAGLAGMLLFARRRR